MMSQKAIHCVISDVNIVGYWVGCGERVCVKHGYHLNLQPSVRREGEDFQCPLCEGGVLYGRRYRGEKGRDRLTQDLKKAIFNSIYSGVHMITNENIEYWHSYNANIICEKSEDSFIGEHYVALTFITRVDEQWMPADNLFRLFSSPDAAQEYFGKLRKLSNTELKTIERDKL